MADYLELGSYNAVAKLNGVSKDSVRRIVQDCDGFDQKAQQKKEENTADVLAYGYRWQRKKRRGREAGKTHRGITWSVSKWVFCVKR